MYLNIFWASVLKNNGSTALTAQFYGSEVDASSPQKGYQTRNRDWDSDGYVRVLVV